jgi:DNA-binding response OmpR family regulator
MLADLLAAEGYQVLTATSGEEALAAIAREQPELVLLGREGNRLLRSRCACGVRARRGRP